LYAENDTERLPALSYGAKNINPLSQQLLQIVSMMSLSEDEEEASKKRKALLNALKNQQIAGAGLDVLEQEQP